MNFLHCNFNLLNVSADKNCLAHTSHHEVLEIMDATVVSCVPHTTILCLWLLIIIPGLRGNIEFVFPLREQSQG